MHASLDMPGRRVTKPAAFKDQPLARKNRKRSLNAFAVAESEVQDPARIPKNRFNNLKREEAEWDLSENEDTPASKKLKVGHERPTEPDGGGDSAGEISHVEIGEAHVDDDSSLDSDAAFGEGDDEKFGDFTFRGSSAAKTWTSPSISGSKGLRAVPRPSYKFIQSPSRPGEDDISEENTFANDDEQDAPVYFRENGRDESPGQSLGATHHYEPGADGLPSEEERASELSLSDIDDGAGDVEKLSKLRELAAAFGQNSDLTGVPGPRIDSAQEAITPSEHGIRSRRKLSVNDLLATVTDPQGRKALRMMVDEGKGNRSTGTRWAGKLAVPLAKRKQDALDRAAAYQKSKATLSRWINTVKHNRRAGHLVFPLPDGDAAASKNTSRLPSTSDAKPMTGLEATIQSILFESGMAHPSKKGQDAQIQWSEELATHKIPIEEVEARRAELRRNRDLLFREEIRAKRIKKIKSKSYRRVHRKERQRNLLREKEALGETGVDLEAEQERLEKARAEERMSGRHKESRWAKSMRGTGRTVWDSEARDELTDMARRNEELRQRIRGRTTRSSDLSGSGLSSDDLDSDRDSATTDQRLQKHLQRLEPGAYAKDMSRLGSLKFMKKASATQQLENDEAVKKMTMELANERDSDEASEGDEIVGRRRYGLKPQSGPKMSKSRTINEFEENHGSSDGETRVDPASDHEVEIVTNRPGKSHGNPSTERRTGFVGEKKTPPKQDRLKDNPWLETAKQSRNGVPSTADNAILVSKESHPSKNRHSPLSEFDKSRDHSALEEESVVTPRPEAAPSLVEKQAVQFEHREQEADESPFEGFSPSSSDSEETGGSSKTNAALIRRAFASDDVLATSNFAAEKAALEADEAGSQQEGHSSSHLPGWGSWTGEGLPKRDRRQAAASAARARERSQAEAPKLGQPSRTDGALQNAMISQKRVPKTARYLATALPRPFETRAQYERSLRLPVGREWVAGETFRELVRPRVEVRAGEVVAAMKRPML